MNQRRSQNSIAFAVVGLSRLQIRIFRGVFSEELVTIFKIEAISRNLFRVFDVGAAEESTLDHILQWRNDSKTGPRRE